MRKEQDGDRRSFLRTVLGIAAPVGLQSMLQSSFAMVDQLMVGQLGTAAVAAVEAAGRPAFIYNTVTGAVAASAGIMIAQYLGMGDRERADRSLWVSLAASSALGAVFTALCLLFPGELTSLFLGDSQELLGPGRAYLVRIAWAYLPMGAASVLAVMLRCLDRAVWPLAAGLVSAAVNTVLNYGLIFGHWGLPALGAAGAAGASVVSQLVNLGMIAAMLLRVRGGGELRISLDLGRAGRRQFWGMLLPLAASELLWSLGQSLNTFIYGRMGGRELAAMSVTGPVQGLFIGAMSGVAQAAGILIGRRLGAGEFREGFRESRLLLRYGLAGSLGLSALLLALRGPYVLLYRVEPEVQDTAGALLAAFALLAPVKVANMILGGGILRSGGRTGGVVAMDLIGTWLIGAPVGLAAAFVFRLPVLWVYVLLSQEELARLAMGLWILRRGRWIRRLEG